MASTRCTYRVGQTVWLKRTTDCYGQVVRDRMRVVIVGVTDRHIRYVPSRHGTGICPIDDVEPINPNS